MNRKNLLPKFVAIVVVILIAASCEEDFNSIGSEIIGQDIQFNQDTNSTVISYSRKLVPVQTNNLQAYRMGVYNDPVFGKSISNFLGQLTITQPNPSFGDSAVVDSVILNIPFFSQLITDSEEGSEYTLDSVYGNTPINIEIYESNFLLRDFDPESGFEEPQNYYSNQSSTFESFLGPLITTVQDFVPSTEGTVINVGENDETQISPGFRVKLDTLFFQEKIIEMEGDPVLLNNNNFKNYFRGVYLKVVETTPGNNYFLFNGEAPVITVYYSFNSADDEDEDGREDSAYVLNFDGVNVNTLDGELPPEIESELFNPNVSLGEENLYIQGGEGIISVIELFGDDSDNNGVADELEELRAKDWLINDANLVFYVDKSKVQGGETEPERIKIFDIDNGRVLIDYSFDLTAGNAAIDALTTHLGRLERGSDDNGQFYKIRITNHLSNLVNRDSTNVPLGLLVTQNALLTDFQDTESVQSPGIRSIPQDAILSHEGTVLFGNRAPDPSKRLKLEILYTEPE